MLAYEDPFEAARRGTLEEIGSAIPEGLDEKLEVVMGEFEIVGEKPLTRAPTQWEETIESPSYPSLSTVYTLYQVEAVVEGLPLMEFTTQEMGTDKMLKVTHVWVWHPTIETSGELSLNQVQEALSLAARSCSGVVFRLVVWLHIHAMVRVLERKCRFVARIVSEGQFSSIAELANCGEACGGATSHLPSVWKWICPHVLLLRRPLLLSFGPLVVHQPLAAVIVRKICCI